MALASTALRAGQSGNTVVDAYITYGYARNLASGRGLVYNVGEVVLGTSSPAYAILLACRSGRLRRPLPASLRAKASGLYTLPPDPAARYLARHLAGMTALRLPLGRALPFLPGAAREYATLAASAVLPLLLMGLGARRALRGDTRVAALFVVLYIGLFAASFAVANPFMMGWYYVPLEGMYLALLSIGALEAGRLAASVAPVVAGPARIAVPAVVILLLLVPQARRYEWEPAASLWPHLVSEWEKQRESDYLAAGRDLAAATGGRATVAGPEIGALGWSYPGPILDTAGLVSAESRAYYPLPTAMVAGNSAIPPDLIADRRPDLVVFLEIFGREGLLRDARFTNEYRLWRAYPSHIFGSRGLLVFVRRDAVW